MIDFNFFRLSWGDAFLVPTACDIDDANDMCCNRTYAVNARLPQGWYMLEIEARTDAAQAKGHIVVQRRGDVSESLGITVSSRRISKRLVYLSDAGRIGIVLGFRHSGDGISYFRLARVTNRFARSRMLTKLRALHPLYRSWTLQNGHTEIPSISEDWRQTWHDYCELFDDSAELVAYPDWTKRFDALSSEARVGMRARAHAFEAKPSITIVMTTSDVKPPLLNAAIQAISQQIYPHWTLCIVDRTAPSTPTRALLMAYAKTDSRISVLPESPPDDTSAPLNSALLHFCGEWIAIVGQHDVLPEHALYCVAETINRFPATDLIYSDEDRIDEQGQRLDPNFKCDWNEDLFRSQDMFANLGVYRTELFNAAGGLDAELGAASKYDLTLRCVERTHIARIRHIPRILYHKRIEQEPAAANRIACPEEKEAGRQALERHLVRMGIVAEAISTAHGYRVRYALPEAAPQVSLIIPTRNGSTLLRRCIESILSKTIYPNYEVIVVDNGSDEVETLEYMNQVSQLANVTIVRDDRPFNYSALNNGAAKTARGTLICLVNNDVEVISPDWLNEMVSHAARPEVGVVGARLLYPDDTVQHAGIIMGLSGGADHLHRGLPRRSPGYQARAALIQSFSAVTAACLLVKKSLYLDLGGLNESDLPVAFNDVDFCLRVNQAGYRVVWTPYAELYHHESATRGEDDTPEKKQRADREIAYMRSRWKSLIVADPAYNSNLCLDSWDCRVAWPPRDSYSYTTRDILSLGMRANGSAHLAQEANHGHQVDTVTVMRRDPRPDRNSGLK
jgi:O-antigen biosynthesis protein